jgi:translation initiation factor 1
MADKDKIVYSTEPDWKPEKRHLMSDSPSAKAGQIIYIERDRKQRKGKTVTVLTGLSGDLKSLRKELQRLCGAGGSVKQNVIEIQGDHREKIAEYLQKKGFRTKFKGG